MQVRHSFRISNTATEPCASEEGALFRKPVTSTETGAMETGASRRTVLSDLAQDVSGVKHPTKHKVDLIRRVADKVKTAGIVCARMANPVGMLIE